MFPLNFFLFIPLINLFVFFPCRLYIQWIVCRLHSRKWNRKNYKGPLSWCWVCSIIQPARIWAKHREYTCCSSKNLVLIGFIVLTALTSDLTRWTDFTGFKLKKKKKKKRDDWCSKITIWFFCHLFTTCPHFKILQLGIMMACAF